MMFQAIIISFTLTSIGLAQELIQPPSDLIPEAVLLPNVTLSVSSQIVKCVPVDIQNYPYQAQLLYNGEFSCGGSILSKKTILTAAHCLHGITMSMISIRAGSSFKSSGIVINATRYRIHPNFNARTYDYDIGVITLSEPLTYGPRIGRIELSNTIPDDWARPMISGWVSPYENGFLSDKLQAAKVPLVNCSRSYHSTDRILCAGWVFSDNCQLESGSPLTVSGKQIGVMSFRTVYTQFGYSGVYTSVPTLYSWIRFNTVVD